MTENTENSAKAALRIHMRAVRRQLVQQHPEADWQAGDRCEELLKGLGQKKPGVAAIYRASGNEMDPRPLAECLMKLGWRIALPVCEAIDKPVVFREFKPGDRLAADVMNIQAPLDSAPDLNPNLIIAPVLAFDFLGNRLGQGGGYYDRTLDVLRKSAWPPCYIGLAFAGQEVDHVPVFDHDQRLDAVLTESGYRPFS